MKVLASRGIWKDWNRGANYVVLDEPAKRGETYYVRMNGCKVKVKVTIGGQMPVAKLIKNDG